jgi:hypothetical protein
LPDRSVARDEALTAVRELANPEIDGARRRWAGWFIQVADEEGQFLRLPIGHPALEIVRSGKQPPAKLKQKDRWRSAWDLSDLAAQLSERMQYTAELVDRHRRLVDALSALILISKKRRARVRLVMENARAIRWQGDEISA